MLEPIIQAIDHGDYRTAAKRLQAHLRAQPQDLEAQYYWGYLHERAGKADKAEVIYRALLKKATNRKLSNRIRQSIQRLHDTEQQRYQQAMQVALAQPGNAAPGCLVLEPVATEQKVAIIPKFARLWKLDPYIARLHLPSRGWRFYRTGPIGQLAVYCEELAKMGVKAFCAPLQQLQTIDVFRVDHLQHLPESGQANVTCRSQDDRVGQLSFAWSEVKQTVEGGIPILESVVDIDAQHRLVRKEKTQDYARILDLHLPQRACILRLFDQNYQFRSQAEAPSRAQSSQAATTLSTNRQSWNRLLAQIHDHLPGVPVHDGFSAFSDSVFDFSEFLKLIPAQIDLLRHQETLWDEAFHLYSTLNFVKLGPVRRDLVQR
ncbi:MAG: tetratricopeptide repeat protein [Cyanobacteria bacterium P01_H01_bin.121]